MTTDASDLRPVQKRVLSPELVMAIVSPVGTPFEEFRSQLGTGLKAYSYEPVWIKLSKILHAFAAADGRSIDTSKESNRIADLMSEGDLLCRTAGSAAAVAIQGVNQIRSERGLIHDACKEKSRGPRIAWLIDSLKRPAEVTQLRQIYGDRLLVISLQASDDLRKATLAERIRPQSASLQTWEIDQIVQDLIDRDLDEKDNDGQNVVKTFPMADIFVDVAGDVPRQVGRVLDLLFRNPDYPTPTPEEFGMQLASVAGTRSPELGLKVGAAIMRGDSVVSLGFNAHPHSYDETPKFDPTVADISQLLFDTLSRLGTEVLNDRALRQLSDNPDGYIPELLLGPLKEGRIRHLTEFQQPVHAEMAAILDAVASNAAIADCRIFVTTYPCHGCAKHILRLGLPVIYIEPYPKGRAEMMYGDAVSASFTPFTGVAPRSYERLFSVGADRKLADGARRLWEEEEKSVARPNVNPRIDDAGISTREEFALSQLTVTPS